MDTLEVHFLSFLHSLSIYDMEELILGAKAVELS